MYEKCSLESSETPVLYRGCTVIKFNSLCLRAVLKMNGDVLGTGSLTVLELKICVFLPLGQG